MKSLLIAATLGLLSQTASADQVLNCVIGEKQGTMRIEVLDVTSDPNLKLLKVDLISKVPNPNPGSKESATAHLQGVIAANLSGQGAVLADGTLFNAPDSTDGHHVIINPLGITLQSDAVGFSRMSLVDSDRQLQHGFGVPVECK